MTPGAAAALGAVAALVVVALALAGLVAWMRFLARRYGTADAPDAIHFATTADGWRLALHRYAADGPLAPGRAPLLLCHGILTNRRNLDLDAQHSLARWLRARGHDVWLLDLRGCGASRRPGDGVTAPGAISFDDFVALDAPAALALVRRVTGAPAVDWIGYSMGGMIGASWAGDPRCEGLRALVLVGTPMRFGGDPTLRRLARIGHVMARTLGKVPVRREARVASALAGRLDAPVVRIIFNPANIEPEVLRRAMHEMIEDLHAGVLEQFAGWMGDGVGPLSRDGGVDYLARLHDVDRPALVVAGTGDRLAPFEAVDAVYRALAGPVDLHVVGRSAPDRLARHAAREGRRTCEVTEHEWGHGDLVLGREAPARVYEAIDGFLDRLARADGAA